MKCLFVLEILEPWTPLYLQRTWYMGASAKILFTLLGCCIAIWAMAIIILPSASFFSTSFTEFCQSHTLNWSWVTAKPKCNLMKKHLSLFLKSIAPVDQRSFAAGTVAVFSALSGSVMATQTVLTTLTSCLWTSNVWLQVRLLFGSQLESLHLCLQQQHTPRKLAGTYGGNKRRRVSSKEINPSRSIVRSKTSPPTFLRNCWASCQWQSCLALFRKLVQWLILHVLQWTLHLWEESLWWERWLRRPVGWEELQCERMLEPQSQWVHTRLPRSSCGIQGKWLVD